MADGRQVDHQYTINRPLHANRTVVIQQNRRPTPSDQTGHHPGSSMSGHDGVRGTPVPQRVSPIQATNTTTLPILHRLKDVVVVPVHLPQGTTSTVLPAGTTMVPRPASRGSPSAGTLILPQGVVVSASNFVSVPVTSNTHARIVMTPGNMTHRRSPNPKTATSKVESSQRLTVTPPPPVSRSSPAPLPPRLLVPPGVNSGHNGAGSQRVSPRVTVDSQLLSQISPEQAQRLMQAMMPQADLAALGQQPVAQIISRIPSSTTCGPQSQPTDLSLSQAQPEFTVTNPQPSVPSSLPHNKPDLSQLRFTPSIPQKPLHARRTSSVPQRFFGPHIVTPISARDKDHVGVPVSVGQVAPVALSQDSSVLGQPVSHRSHTSTEAQQCHLVANLPAGPGIVSNGVDMSSANAQLLSSLHLPASLLESQTLSLMPDLTNCVTNHASHTETAMPELTPEKTLTSEKPPLLQNAKQPPPEGACRERLVAPFNMRVKNLDNFPSTQTSYRANYRSHAYAIHRAKNFLNALQRARTGSITSAAKSLDLLRQNLQKHINKEINVIIQRYMNFFKVGIENIKKNNGPTSVTDEHVATVCRQILEEAKKMYVAENQGSVPEAKTTTENAPSPSNSLRENQEVREKKMNLFNIPKRRGSSDSEASIPKKRKKGRPPTYGVHGVSGRSTPSKTGKSHEPVKREGPKWDPERLTTETRFVMGAKANKALGLGATRGRLYIKHPELFKYCGDQDDKQWLFEKQHMPATGGKAYMLVVEDIKDLAVTDEYKDNPGLVMDSLDGFSVPEWIIEKMQARMREMRSDYLKPARHRGRAAIPNPTNQESTSVVTDGDPPLPFTSLMSDTDKPSPSNTETLDLLSTDQDEIDPPDVSPYNMTGGFNPLSPAPSVSPAPSELDTLDDDVPTPFGTTD